PNTGSTSPRSTGTWAVNVGLKASRKPYVEKRCDPYVSRIVMSAGIEISGANGTAAPAAVGASVPSSLVSSDDTPRAQEEWNWRVRPFRTSVVFAGPSEAVSPQIWFE